MHLFLLVRRLRTYKICSNIFRVLSKKGKKTSLYHLIECIASRNPACLTHDSIGWCFWWTVTTLYKSQLQWSQNVVFFFFNKGLIVSWTSQAFPSGRTDEVNYFTSLNKGGRERERISTYQANLIPLTNCMLTIYCSWLANDDCELCTHLLCTQYSMLWENNLWSDKKKISQMFI